MQSKAISVCPHGTRFGLYDKHTGRMRFVGKYLSRLTFIKNDKGEVTAVIHHVVGMKIEI